MENPYIEMKKKISVNGIVALVIAILAFVGSSAVSDPQSSLKSEYSNYQCNNTIYRNFLFHFWWQFFTAVLAYSFISCNASAKQFSGLLTTDAAFQNYIPPTFICRVCFLFLWKKFKKKSSGIPELFLNVFFSQCFENKLSSALLRTRPVHKKSGTSIHPFPTKIRIFNREIILT